MKIKAWNLATTLIAHVMPNADPQFGRTDILNKIIVAEICHILKMLETCSLY